MSKKNESKIKTELVTIEEQVEDTKELQAKQDIGITMNKYGYDSQDMKTIVNTVAKGANASELMLFLHQSKKLGLDPLTNQIHFIKYGKGEDTKISIQTGIDGFRAIAERSGVYAGSDDYTFDGGKTQYEIIEKHGGNGKAQPKTATVTVYKVIGGARIAFTATAEWSAYFPANKKNQFMWKKMPFLMLGKCAEALALRKAFPQDLSNVYIYEEMQQAGSPVGTIPTPQNSWDQTITDPSLNLPEKSQQEESTEWRDKLANKLMELSNGESEPQDVWSANEKNGEYPKNEAEAKRAYAEILKNNNKKNGKD